MHRFYFNECLPEEFNEAVFITAFISSIKEFNILLSKDIEIENSIITEKLPSTLMLKDGYSLLTSIQNINEFEVRRLAFSYFNKYPIHDYYTVNDNLENQLLENEYLISVGHERLSALNLAIVSKNNGYAFSVAIHDDIKKNALEIKSKENIDNLVIPNFYGDNSNSDYTTLELKKLNAEKLGILDRLKYTLENWVFSIQFEKDFNCLTKLEQESIITYFEKAKARNLATKYYPDTKIISEVTPVKYNCKVYELRVYLPTALRVYFHEKEGLVYIGSIGFKNEDTQNEDIKKAHNIIYKLILTN